MFESCFALVEAFAPAPAATAAATAPLATKLRLDTGSVPAFRLLDMIPLPAGRPPLLYCLSVGATGRCSLGPMLLR